MFHPTDAGRRARGAATSHPIIRTAIFALVFCGILLTGAAAPGRAAESFGHTEAGSEGVVDSVSGPATGDAATRPAESEVPAITAVWANSGEDKVTRDELRAGQGLARLTNRVWDGERIRVFGGRNEVVGFNLVLEAGSPVAASSVSVEFDRLTGPEDFVIESAPSAAAEVFDWTRRDIELFYVRYLQIRGLSVLSYGTYDERHIPARFRRPKGADGSYIGGWNRRPDHDKYYPDIAVPIELVPTFSIASRQNQSIWSDIYIPKNAPAGLFKGEVIIRVAGVLKYRVPVELRVRNFTLPDTPNSKTMVATSYHDVAQRYTGIAYPAANSPQDKLTKLVMDRQMLLAHRHKISLIDDNSGATAWTRDRPRPEWEPRLSGALFTAANGYRGPGTGIGNNVFSIGTYGQWRDWWGEPRRATMWQHADGWESWFAANSPDTERFLYLIDESEDFAQTQLWADWLKDNPGVGANLKSFATADLIKSAGQLASVDIIASWFRVGSTAAWQSSLDRLHAKEGKQLYLYNGYRPASGSFAIEDDGVALRELAWGQYKKKIDRWFFWSATYYDDYQGGRGPTNVFQTAQTFGSSPKFDKTLGMLGWNTSNGDGVLFYPGTDNVFPAESYALAGPIASLRLKHWRRGIQDVDYLTMAAKVNPQAVAELVQQMVPKILWENDVTDPADPTWVTAPISWSTNPDDWEAARMRLVDIIEQEAP